MLRSLKANELPGTSRRLKQDQASKFETSNFGQALEMAVRAGGPMRTVV